MSEPPHLLAPEALEAWHAMNDRTIAVDFDGTLHPYTAGWTGSTPDDESPIAGALQFLANLHDLGYRVVVFSCRADHDEGKVGIQRWLDVQGLAPYVDDVTHLKLPAVAYVDDRAVPFSGSWGEVIDGIERLAGHRTHGAAKPREV